MGADRRSLKAQTEWRSGSRLRDNQVADDNVAIISVGGHTWNGQASAQHLVGDSTVRVFS
jgi:hypothetical protein